MILDLPATLTVDILAIPTHNLVADNVKMTGGLVAQELLKQRANDRAHSRRQNDDGHIVVLGPVVKLRKEGVQLHVLLQCLDTLVVRGVDALKHFAEGVPKCRRWLGCNLADSQYFFLTENPTFPRGPDRSIRGDVHGRTRDCQSATVSWDETTECAKRTMKSLPVVLSATKLKYV